MQIKWLRQSAQCRRQPFLNRSAASARPAPASAGAAPVRSARLRGPVRRTIRTTGARPAKAVLWFSEVFLTGMPCAGQVGGQAKLTRPAAAPNLTPGNSDVGQQRQLGHGRALAASLALTVSGAAWTLSD